MLHGGYASWNRRAAGAALLLAASVGACSGSTTQQGAVEVTVTTDLTVPDELDALRFQVSQQGSGGSWVTRFEGTFALPGEATLPTTFSIAAGESASQIARVRAIGLKDGLAMGLREVQIEVPRARVAALTMLLGRYCYGRGQVAMVGGEQVSTCAAGESCQPDTATCASSVLDLGARPPSQAECSIGGARYIAGAAKPGEACQTCQPSVSAASWSTAADGRPCGAAGVCHGGSCVSGCEIGGVYYASGHVHDANPCEVCSPTSSTGAWTPRDCGMGRVCDPTGACVSGCLVGGVVYASGGANPGNGCESCQPAKSTTAWSLANGKGCGGAAGGTCVAGACEMPPSCAPSGAGMTDCGPGGVGTESCCTSLEVVGGSYSRTYENDASGATRMADAATVSSFRLDKYEVTVGRFRQFVTAYRAGTWTRRVNGGAGKHTHVNGGEGLTDNGNGRDHESGWIEGDDVNVAPTDANLTTNCEANSGTQPTWTVGAGGNENRPVTCANWYEAEAFCIWDGGFLPSEAEWKYAAAGGSEQRDYPWGTSAPGTASDYAIYGCYYGSEPGSCTAAPVGHAAQGAGRWGQLDLAGNAWEWNVDASTDDDPTSYPNPCSDCVRTSSASTRVTRGASFASANDYTRYLRGAAGHDPAPAGARFFNIGFRCARTP
jgi:formylglycine-generating enzyme